MALLPVAEALQRVLDGVVPMPAVATPLLAAAGRVLAADVQATLTQPPFDTSAMDGYAVRSADTLQPPVTLDCVGESAAGRAYNGKLQANETIRISTGAPVPASADSIVIQEDTERQGDAVTVREPAASGQHIRKRGFDFADGDTLLSAGQTLDARLITLAAAGGHATLPVRRRPVVAILATGDELVEPGTTPGPDQIIGSNAYGLAAMVQHAGGEPRLLGIAKDTRPALAEKIAEAADADVLVTIGGASVGDHDHIGPALKAAGVSIDFWKIAMRPGKPMLFGTNGPQRVLGLPGNPVSCLVTARVFLVPLIQRLIGRPLAADRKHAVLGTALEANGPRVHFMRATLTASSSSSLPVATPLSSQDSSSLSRLGLADAFVIRPIQAPEAQPGDRVEIMPFDF